MLNEFIAKIMKKQHILILILSFPAFLLSCNQWLDVRPEDEIDEKDLFTDGEGYRNALNGVYKALAEYDLYGRNLTWGIVDALGQCYDYSYAISEAEDMKYGAAEYDWENTKLKPNIEKMWKKAYNAVANCNNIIRNIQNEDPGKFSGKENERKMIWGEALALRAFIQFDMLRLFAAAPAVNPTKNYIAYINVYPSYVSAPLSTQQCLEHIITDLKMAQPLIYAFDSEASMKVGERFDRPGSGDSRFTKSRGFRLNYYAVTALLARAYLYNQQADSAYKQAKQIIDYQDEKQCFSFQNNVSSGDRKFYSDVISGLYAPKLPEWEKRMNDFTDENNVRYLSLLNVTSIFSPDLEENDDYILESDDDRYTYWIEDYKLYGNFFIPIKYREETKVTQKSEVSNKLIPLIRMSEVYYIAAEACCNKDLSEATEYLCRVKEGRGLSTSAVNTIRNSITDAGRLMEEVIKDARREFIGEGQIFFIYKRRNEPIPAKGNKTIPATEEKFVLPVPESENTVN